MKKFAFVIIYFVIGISVFSQPLPANLNRFLNTPELKHASIGICIQDMEGNYIASYNADKALTPASILKLVTTASALETLGSDYRYTTSLGSDLNVSNRVIVQGQGDPTLGSEYLSDQPTLFLKEWSKKISEKFNNKAIDLMIADDYFGYLGTSSKWLREDLGNYFAAGAYGISVFDNAYKLYLNTENKNISPQIIRTDPVMEDIIFFNNLELNTTGQDNGYIWGEPFSSNRLLTGNIPAKKQAFYIKGDIPDPGLYLGKRLAEALTESGVRVNEVKTSRQAYYAGNFSQEMKVFHTHYSPPLRNIIRIVNVKSNNHYAEHLIRTIGRTKSPNIYTNPLNAGIEQIQNFWTSKGINTDALFMYDGSGLAPSNGVSPQLICDILIYMQTRSKHADVFLASLPKAGKEGTVQNFMKGTPVSKKIVLKSGSIANVQCYAGYYMDGNKRYAFTVMVNNFNSPRRNTVKAIELLLSSIFESIA